MAEPGAAFDSFMRDTAPAAKQRQAWTPADGPLPALFLSHGAPPLYDNAAWMAALFAWAQSLSKPKAILVVSAHWEQAPLGLSATAQSSPLIYDFGGFPQRYYSMKYGTPDAGLLGRQVGELMSGEQWHQHNERGLDHGAWVPMSVMYPDADVPVLQLSIPTHDPDRLLALGRRLRPLRDQGVLIVGSGHMTHGLPFMTPEMFAGTSVPGWSSDFDAWANDALSRGDVDELTHYAAAAPGMPYAHPTVEHLVPMFVTLGASTDPEQPVTTTIDGYWFGLSKRSFQVD